MLNYKKIAKVLLSAIAIGFFACLVPMSLCADDGTNPGVNMAITPEDRDIDRFHEQSARMEEGDVDLL